MHTATVSSYMRKSDCCEDVDQAALNLARANGYRGEPQPKTWIGVWWLQMRGLWNALREKKHA